MSGRVRQRCPLYNLFMDKITKIWKEITSKEMKLTNTEQIEALLLADDVVIMAKNEDDLQRNVFSLKKIAEGFKMEISNSKTEVIAPRGKESVRSKIMVKGRIVERVRNFKYMSVDIYEGEVDKGRWFNPHSEEQKIVAFYVVLDTKNN